MLNDVNNEYTGLQKKLGDIIEGAVFSGAVQILILASAVAFVLETESELYAKYETLFDIVDWTFPCTVYNGIHFAYLIQHPTEKNLYSVSSELLIYLQFYLLLC